MCRKTYLRGCCIAVFALGLLVGHWLESGFLCFCISAVLLILGLGIMGKK